MKKYILLALIAFGSFQIVAQIWNQIALPTSENLLDIEFPPGTSSVGYIGGENGVLLKTTDGGANWTNLTYSGIDLQFSFSFLDLEFANDLIGFAAVSAGVYKTVDGGLNWTLLDDSALGSFCYKQSLHVIDSDHLFVAGAGCFQSAMIAEFDNGVWSEKTDDHETFNPSEYVKDIEFHGNVAVAATNGDKFLRSTDNGQNWISVQSPVFAASGVLSELMFLDANHVLAGHEIYAGHYLFYESLDGGATWDEFQSIVSGDLVFYGIWLAFEKSTAGTVYAHVSQQGGPHFIQRYTAGLWSYEEVDEIIWGMDSYGSDEVFAVGENGYLVRNSGAQLGIEEIKQSIRVFPNPSQDRVTVQATDIQSAKLFDQAGRTVNLEFHPRADGWELNLSALDAGTYQLSVSFDGKNETLTIVKD